MLRKTILGLATLLAIAAHPAAADDVKSVKVPRNLDASSLTWGCQDRKALFTNCRFDILATPDYQAAKRAYTTDPLVLEVSQNTYRDSRTGGYLKGVTYEKSRKTRNKKADEVTYDWLIDPKYADIIIWDTRFAFVQDQPGGDWSRLTLPGGKKTPLNGQVIWLDEITQPLQGYNFPTKGGVDKARTLAVLAKTDAEGLLTIQRITTEGDVVGEPIDRVVSQDDIALTRGPVEVFSDNSLLVHRLDADGQVFDQVFSSDLAKALTPPLPPLHMASFKMDERNFQPVRIAVLDIDASRNLFWPVMDIDSLYAKPPELMGLTPLQARYSITNPSVIKPYVFDRPSRGRFGNQLPECTTVSTGCEFGFFWFAAWDTAEGPRLAGVPKSEFSLPVDLNAVLQSRSKADLVGFAFKGRIPEANFQRYFDQIYARAMGLSPYVFAELASGGFQMMVFNLDWWRSSPTSSGPLSLKFYASVPEVFVASEEAKAWAAAQSAQTNYVDGLVAQRTADEKRRRDDAIALAQRIERERQQRVASFRASLQSYEARGDYANALAVAARIDAEAVKLATLAALRAGARDSVSWSDTFAAAGFRLTADENRLVADQQRYLEQQDYARLQASQRRYSASGTSSTYSPSSSGPDLTPLDQSVEQNLRWQSQLDYLSGKSSNYRCGSSSFCN